MSLELLAVFVTSFLVGLSGALMPGPLVTLAIGETARGGFVRGPAVVLGHAVVEIIAVVGLLVGLSELVQNELVAAGIGIVGGLVLLWLGYGMGRGALSGELDLSLGQRQEVVAPLPVYAVAGEHSVRQVNALREPISVSRSLLASPAVRGGLVSVVNPYWLIWWATVGAAYVSKSLALGVAGFVAFYAGHILADLGWISLVSLIVASGRRALSPQVYRGIILFCAVVLVALGLYFLSSGLPSVAKLVGR